MSDGFNGTADKILQLSKCAVGHESLAVSGSDNPLVIRAPLPCAPALDLDNPDELCRLWQTEHPIFRSVGAHRGCHLEVLPSDRRAGISRFARHPPPAAASRLRRAIGLNAEIPIEDRHS